MSTAMRDFYIAIGLFKDDTCDFDTARATANVMFNKLTEEEQDFVYAIMDADVYDSIS